jgi:hypothetical protein
MTTNIPVPEAQDLIALCHDRELHTSELFSWNAFYGLDHVVKRYASLPASYALKAILPHGIVLSNHWVHTTEANAPLDTVFCYPPSRVPAYQRQTTKRILPSCHPIAYVADMFEAEVTDRKGTLFFPSHSTHHVVAEQHTSEIAESLVTLPEEFQPVTVCMYWKDVLLGHAPSYEKFGLRVVSAGHMYDPEFLFRLYGLCRSFRYAAGNQFGSHTFYSTFAGCRYFKVEAGRPTIRGRAVDIRRDTLAPDPEIASRLEQIYRTVPAADDNIQTRETGLFLGLNHKLTPTLLRRALLRAEMTDKLKLSFGRGIKPSAKAPAAFRRFAERVRRLARTI